MGCGTNEAAMKIKGGGGEKMNKNMKIKLKKMERRRSKVVTHRSAGATTEFSGAPNGVSALSLTMYLFLSLNNP